MELSNFRIGDRVVALTPNDAIGYSGTVIAYGTAAYGPTVEIRTDDGAPEDVMHTAESCVSLWNGDPAATFSWCEPCCMYFQDPHE